MGWGLERREGEQPSPSGLSGKGGSLSKTATPLGRWVHLTSPPLNPLHLLARAPTYRSHQEPREEPPPPLPLLLKTAVVAVGVGGSGQPGQPACKPELERALLEEAPEPG